MFTMSKKNSNLPSETPRNIFFIKTVFRFLLWVRLKISYVSGVSMDPSLIYLYLFSFIKKCIYLERGSMQYYNIENPKEIWLLPRSHKAADPKSL